MFIWILCLTKVHTKKALLCGWARMSQFAKEAGCEIMETGTPLEKVGSHLLNTGWDLNTVEYSKRVK